MDFDVEKEASKLAERLRPQPCFQDSYTRKLADFARRAIAATEQRVEEECIKGVCFRCNRGELPVLTETGWWHNPDSINLVMCSAKNIHERRRRREAGRGEGEG